jgi:hypothetical protein
MGAWWFTYTLVSQSFHNGSIMVSHWIQHQAQHKKHIKRVEFIALFQCACVCGRLGVFSEFPSYFFKQMKCECSEKTPSRPQTHAHWNNAMNSTRLMCFLCCAWCWIQCETMMEPLWNDCDTNVYVNHHAPILKPSRNHYEQLTKPLRNHHEIIMKPTRNLDSKRLWAGLGKSFQTEFDWR